jgi:CBS domain-containing protein
LSTSSIPVEFDALLTRLRGGDEATATVRTLLAWFGEPRRSAAAIERISEALARAGVEARPNFADAWIDEPLTFTLPAGLPPEAPPPERTSSPTPLRESAPPTATPVSGSAPAVEPSTVQPVNRIGAIAAAHRTLVRVGPDAPLSDAFTALRLDDLSCVAVTSHDDRRQYGVITWRSLAKALARVPITEPVRHFTEPVRVYKLNDDVFEVARAVHAEGPVLIEHADKKFHGPITREDLLTEFGTRLEPFLLVGEIESVVRTIVETRLPDAVAQLRQERPSSANGLTLGECEALLQRDENFQRSGIDLVRSRFTERLGAVRGLRNDLMHFNRGDAVGPSEIITLRNFVQALRESARARD